MTANNSLLTESIKKCFNQFNDYYSLINEQWKRLNLFLNNPNDDELFEKIFHHEDDANVEYRKNAGRVEWYICQQTPVANNLRFFLATLMSLKDLERCGDYVNIIAKIFKTKNIYRKTEITNEVIKIWNILIEKLNAIWSIFIENAKKLSEEDFIKIIEIKCDFNEEYKAFFSNINESFISKIDKSNFKNDISHIFIISVKIDRTIDHIFNIVKNFYLIDKPGLDLSKIIESNCKSDI